MRNSPGLFTPAVVNRCPGERHLSPKLAKHRERACTNLRLTRQAVEVFVRETGVPHTGRTGQQAQPSSVRRGCAQCGSPDPY
ncbi:Hypp5146 [Branchiostoma lanceolatum]|uniref:Hypp5146 protein n=1 Tax=Branchiostoma lanceolatum TaxID=7740 RepID=A0A8K0AIK3_BRALA|nr:Hypp5146 [Branchiostoma lanceolatum]